MGSAWFAWVTWLNAWAPLWASAIGRPCWQGGWAIALVWAIGRAFRGVPPRERCWLWRLAYLKWLVALFCATPLDIRLLPTPPRTHSIAVVTRPSQLPVRLARGPSPSPAGARPGRPAVSPRRPRTQPLPVAVLALVWLLGVGGYAWRVAGEWHGARRLRTACRPVAETRWSFACTELGRRLGMRRMPRLLVAEGTGSPLLAGLIHPTIIIPSSLLAESSDTELRWILAHELAHLKRHDLVWGWLPAAVQALFFFHPILWLARHDRVLAKEVASDALALQVMNAPPAEYGEVLLKVAIGDPTRLARGQSAVGVFTSTHALEQRLIAMKEICHSPRRSRRVAAWLLAALGVASIAPWRVVAQERISGLLERTVITPSAGGIWSIAISPDGETLASTAARMVGPGGNRHEIQEVDLWDLQTGRMTGTLPAPGEILTSVAFSPDGELLAGGGGLYGRAGQVSLWNLATRAFKQALPEARGVVSSVAFSPDGKLLASGGGDGTVQLWDPTTGTLHTTLADQHHPIRAIAFSPDGATLACAGGTPDSNSEVTLWDLRTRTVQQTLTEKSSRLFSIAFSPNGRLLATGSSRRTQGTGHGEVKLWDVHTGELKRTLSVNSEVAHQIAFVPNGTALAVGGTTDDSEGTIQQGELSLWDAPTGRLLWSVTGAPVGMGAVTIALSPDGTRLASSEASHSVRIWRLR